MTLQPKMHALHKIITNCARPKSSTVTPGSFVEIEPDVFSVILSPNGSDAKKLMADLDELGVKELPLKERIFAVSDHASPAPTMQLAASQKLWCDFYRSHGVRVFDGGAGVSHLVLCEEGIALPGTLGIAIDSHGHTMGAVGMYATSLGGGRLTLYAIGRYFLEVPKVTLVKVQGLPRVCAVGARGMHIAGEFAQHLVKVGAMGGEGVVIKNVIQTDTYVMMVHEKMNQRRIHIFAYRVNICGHGGEKRWCRDNYFPSWDARWRYARRSRVWRKSIPTSWCVSLRSRPVAVRTWWRGWWRRCCLKAWASR